MATECNAAADTSTVADTSMAADTSMTADTSMAAIVQEAPVSWTAVDVQSVTGCETDADTLDPPVVACTQATAYAPTAPASAVVPLAPKATLSTKGLHSHRAASSDKEHVYWLKSLQCPWKLVVSEPHGIHTDLFLLALDDIQKLQAKFGISGTISSLDMRRNEKKLRQKYEESAANKNTSMEDMIVAESLEESVSDQKDRLANNALFWLLRALHLTSVAVRKILDDKDRKVKLRLHFLAAYDETLKQHHGKWTQFVSHAGFRTMPSRKKLLKQLAPEDEVEYLLNDWVTGLAVVVKRLNALYDQHGWNDRVHVATAGEYLFHDLKH